MDPVRWQAVSRLYHEAAARPLAEREAFLAEACAGDDSLMFEVESLLKRPEGSWPLAANQVHPARPTTRREPYEGAPTPAARLSGQQLGGYEVRTLLGAGGMGEVYLARDLRLGRDVALKIPSQEFMDDPARLVRFEREARALAALNHPNIATIYGIEESPGATDSGQVRLRAIVMELVDGETLAARIARGPLPITEALPIARQIADALDAAHEKGIIHRDLKPANVKITPKGIAKVLDFGLAKAVARDPSEVATVSGTRQGLVVGTAAYMSPEQARGRPVDQRTDIWAFGCVLFEMLVGRAPFEADTFTETVARVLEREPAWHALPPVPPAIRRLIRQCLDKDPTRRLRDIGDARLALGAPVRIRSDRLPRARAVIDSIAILPFQNAGGNLEIEYLSDGLTEAIINSLSDTRKVRVMARSTVFRYKTSPLRPQQIGAELQVAAVLTGLIAIRADRVTVSAELVSVADGSQLWGGQYTHQSLDLMTIERELSTQITEALRVRLSAEQRRRLVRRQTASTDAYHLYLRGRFFLNKRTLDAIRKAIEQFQEAIDRDPEFARAYAGLADCHIVMGTGGFGVVPSREALTRALAAATRAIELDDHLAEAHRSLGQIHLMATWNWTASEREFERALKLGPRDAMTHSWFAELSTVRGRFDEGIAAARRGVELEPLSINATFYLMRVLYYARRYSEVIEEGRKVFELEPSFYRANLMLAPAYQMSGRGEDAVRVVDKLIGIVGANPFLVCLRADLQARNGDRSAALATLEEMKQIAHTRYVDPFDIARIYIGLGDADGSFEWLERAFRERSTWLIWLNVSPFSDGLRDDPRFASLVARIGSSGEVDHP